MALSNKEKQARFQANRKKRLCGVDSALYEIAAALNQVRVSIEAARPGHRTNALELFEARLMRAQRALLGTEDVGEPIRVELYQ